MKSFLEFFIVQSEKLPPKWKLNLRILEATTIAAKNYAKYCIEEDRKRIIEKLSPVGTTDFDDNMEVVDISQDILNLEIITP